MIVKAIIAASAIAIAAPALADSQLERSLGVESGVYTTAQLIRLQQAAENSDRHTVKHILSSYGKSARMNLTAGADAHRSQVIASALEENDFNRARFMANGNPNDNSGALAVNKRQIALSVGVDADAYSLSQLIKLQDERQD